MRSRVRSSFLLTLALAILPATAAAQQRDPAAAQALFDEGLKLMKAGRHADACPKLTESQRLDPGVGTQFHLGDCLERIGRTASAWALFLEVESVAKASGQKDREQVAAARAKRLEARLPRLRIVVPEGRGVPGLEVVRDGMVVGSAQWGTPIPVDPGPHEIVSSAPGRRSVMLKVEAREAETATFEVPELAAEAAGSHSEPSSENAEPAEPVERTEPGSRPTAWILGLGGVGVVGVGIGTTFALMARSENQKSKASCHSDNPNLCNAGGVAERNRALAKGNVATVAFAVGGAALAGAAVLWLVSGDSEGSEPSKGRPTTTGVTGVALGIGPGGGAAASVLGRF